MFVALAVSACTSEDSSYVIERTHDACAPLALVSEAASSLQLEGMQAGQDLWVDRGAPALGRRAGATLEVRFEEAAGAFHGFYDDHEAIIYINDGIANREALAIVVAHELGHAFGLLHVPASERPSIMNPGNLTTPPTVEDQRAIEALWGACL